MSKQKLKEALLRLKEALNEMDPGDAESRDLLLELSDAIEEKIIKPQAPGKHTQLQEKLKQQAVYFKVQHPLISSALDEIADVLTHLGI